MHNQPLKVQIENFRAIQNAQIQIDDITVIAGVNGSGKSTVSKFAYQVIKTAVHFDELVDDLFKRVLKREMQNANIVVSEIFSALTDDIIDIQMRELRRELLNITRHLFDELPDETDKAKFINNFETILNIVKPYINDSNIEKANNVDYTRLKRLRKSLINSLNESNETLSVFELLKKYHLYLKNELPKKQGETANKREIHFADKILNQAFEEDSIFKSLNVFESDVPILDKTKRLVSQMLSIENVFFLDSPMMLGWVGEENDHWTALDNILRKKVKIRRDSTSIETYIKSEILQGDVASDDSNFFQDGFVYKRKDGAVFDLLDCATGLKSFAIVQLLLQRGLLTDKTLLIIDEPEAHLHPQWVVEYARMVVLLNKELGVRFLIASHHPEMVSAIKYISEKENPGASVNFYLAEKSTSNQYQYVYNHLGTDIEPIFASFNAAYDKLDEYGETQKQ